MLLQLLIHPGKLQGPVVEVLIRSDGGQLKAERVLRRSCREAQVALYPHDVSLDLSYRSLAAGHPLYQSGI